MGIANHGSSTQPWGWLVTSRSPWTPQPPNLHLAMQLLKPLNAQGVNNSYIIFFSTAFLAALFAPWLILHFLFMIQLLINSSKKTLVLPHKHAHKTNTLVLGKILKSVDMPLSRAEVLCKFLQLSNISLIVSSSHLREVATYKRHLQQRDKGRATYSKGR